MTLFALKRKMGLSVTQTQTATDRYGRRVTVFFIIDNVARTDRGFIHVTKLFVGGNPIRKPVIS